MALSNLDKTIQNIMRKDTGVDGDAQRISQLTWMLFLKIYDRSIGCFEISMFYNPHQSKVFCKPSQKRTFDSYPITSIVSEMSARVCITSPALNGA